MLKRGPSNAIVKNGRIARFVAALVLATAIAPAGAEPQPPIFAKAEATVKCVYRVFKSNPAVQSAEAYGVDDFRFAIEITFRGKDGRLLTSDTLVAVMPDGSAFESGMTLEAMDVMGRDVDKALRSKCHVPSAFDNLLPGPNDRAEWQRIDLGISPTNESPRKR